MDNLRGQPLRTFTEEGQDQRTIKKDRPPMTFPKDNQREQLEQEDSHEGQGPRTTPKDNRSEPI